MPLLSLFFSFHGRVGRGDFWYAVLLILSVFTVLSIALDESVVLRPLSWALFIPVYWTLLAVAIKRYHDIGRSGWWLLLLLIPLIDTTNEKYTFNTDYHLMIVVIGTSTTIEYGLKGGYESLVGKPVEATRIGGPTAEERLSAKVARDYVDYIVVEPWYKFDFISPLKRLWTDTGLWGPDPLRKWERKYFLTSEYAAKGLYAWVIKKASESVYDEEKPVTAVVLDRLPANIQRELPELRVVKDYPDGAVLALVPRYQAFTRHAQILAKAGVNFLEIAGNADGILVSTVVPSDYDASGLKLLLVQPILTRPGWHRLVINVPVPELAAFLRERDHPPFRLEHVYDY